MSELSPAVFERLQPLEPETAWARFRRFTEQLTESFGRETFLAESLDALVDALGADCGLVATRGADGAFRIVAGRRSERGMSALERSEVCTSVIDAALERDHCVARRRPKDDVIDTSESFVELEIHTAMAAPLRAVRWTATGEPENVRTIVYVDFRSAWLKVNDVHRDLLEAACVALSTALTHRSRLHRSVSTVPAPPATERTQSPSLDDLIGLPGLAAIRQDIRSVVSSRSSILIQGESGTGKTRLARAIAEASGRGPVVRAMLGASDDLNTITSELFGHARGAFSGAVAKRVGLVEHADGGTLILDEILNLPTHAQQLLLDFTQFGTYRPLGHAGREPKTSEVRIIAATNGDIGRAIQEGRFREDLYYRLAGAEIVIPPLRERRSDLPELAASILSSHSPDGSWRLSLGARRWLLGSERPWNGNVRELEAVLRRACDRKRFEGDTDVLLRPRHLDPRRAYEPTPLAVTTHLSPPEATPLSEWTRLQAEREQLTACERALISRVVSDRKGVLARAARELGIPRTTLISRMQRLGLRRS